MKFTGRQIGVEIESEDAPGVFYYLATINTKSINIMNASMDATTADPDDPGDELWRESLDGMKSIDISGDGVLATNAQIDELIEVANSEGATRRMRVLLPTDASNNIVTNPWRQSLEGDFRLTSFEVGGEVEGHATFSITMESVGDVEYEYDVGVEVNLIEAWWDTLAGIVGWRSLATDVPVMQEWMVEDLGTVFKVQLVQASFHMAGEPQDGQLAFYLNSIAPDGTSTQIRWDGAWRLGDRDRAVPTPTYDNVIFTFSVPRNESNEDDLIFQCKLNAADPDPALGYLYTIAEVINDTTYAQFRNALEATTPGDRAGATFEWRVETA